MPIAPGERLGPYQIVAPLGAGGMGEVYKARDTRLDRLVAVKISKSAFEERFRNEARAVAALNHPHVCALYDVGPDYLVMEYVDGTPLRGPLPVGEALRLGGQIADALEHAHKHGIVHRDLKPSNILITRAGAKVLDFGLAKRLPPRRPSDESATLATAEAALVGTPRYMAPEQIEGTGADERTDIFAFGLVLYEMLTGRRAFEGQSAAGVMAAILERDPTPISALNRDIPPAVAKVVETCLAKDAADRWQSVREMKHALAWASRADQGSVAGRRSRAVVAGGAALILLAIALAFAIAFRNPKPGKARAVQLEVALPEKATFDVLDPLAVSPDGERIAMSLILDGQPMPRLFVRALDSVHLTPVPGAEHGLRPFWSPDGTQLAFFSMGMLKRVKYPGGSPEVVCRAGSAQGGTWGPDGTIVFSDGGRLFRVPAAGGEPSLVEALVEGETGRYWPSFLPDGRHYLYLSLNQRREDEGVYAGSLDAGLRKRIVATGHNAAYSPGHLLFMRDEALMAQPFDAKGLELSGEAFPVLGQVMRLSGNTTAGLAHFSVSANGVLAWRAGSPAAPKQLTWFDRSGKKLGTLGEPAILFAPALSPDEKSVAVCRVESATNRDVWIVDVASGAQRRLTFDPHDECGQTWSADGTRIAFFSDRRGVREIYQKAADGSGEEKLLVESRDFPMHVEDWSADGRFIVLNSPRSRTSLDLLIAPLPPSRERTPFPFQASAAVEHRGKFSPNGRWLVYCSTESGRPEIYVRDFTPQGRPGPGKWQISKAGGWVTRWRRDGKEILYAAGETILSVAVQGDGPLFEPGTATPIGATLGVPGDAFDVTRDGQRLLMLVPLKTHEPIRVLVNWLPPEH